MIYNIAMSLIDIECSYLLSREWKLFHFKTTEKCDETVRGEKYFFELNVYQRCANILLTKGVLHLHSSFVLHQGKALLFTGPSGIGKTTQAELWRDYQGSMIVNGDACLMRKIEGAYFRYHYTKTMGREFAC